MPSATINVKDAAGATVALEKPIVPARAAAADSRPVVLSTEDKAALDALNTILGVAADTASASTTIKAALRQVATALGSTAITRAAGAADANTLRVTMDTGQVSGLGAGTIATSPCVNIASDQLGTLVAGGVPTVSGGHEYETVAVSQTDQILGATGGVGDYLECLLCVVATAATSQVQIKDGNGTTITVLPNAVGAGVGTYPVPIGLTCINATTPGWKITTAAGVTVLATGNFT